MQPLRVGAVEYLNTKPLIHNLNSIAPDWELILKVPSLLASDLAQGKLDVGLIPVVEHFRNPIYRIIPGISIASNGPVLSVTLFSKVPWPKIRSVALDQGSRTSVSLLTILSRELHQTDFAPSTLSMDADPSMVPEDAVLLIGDRAMKACLPGFPFAYDLGQEWQDFASLPFVYAFWAVHPRAFSKNLTKAFALAKKHGQKSVGEIAQQQAHSLGLDAGFCRRYLSHIIHYNLGSKELAGLELYQSLLLKHGLIAEGTSIEFHNPRHFAKSC